MPEDGPCGALRVEESLGCAEQLARLLEAQTYTKAWNVWHRKALSEIRPIKTLFHHINSRLMPQRVALTF
jgi:hypothetical protein